MKLKPLFVIAIVSVFAACGGTTLPTGPDPSLLESSPPPTPEPTPAPAPQPTPAPAPQPTPTPDPMPTPAPQPTPMAELPLPLAPGTYTLRISADPGCAGELPAAVTTRTYTALVRRNPHYGLAFTLRLEVVLSGANFRDDWAGTHNVFYGADEYDDRGLFFFPDPRLGYFSVVVIEQLNSTTALLITGSASVSNGVLDGGLSLVSTNGRNHADFRNPLAACHGSHAFVVS